MGGFSDHVGPKSHQKATQNACKILIDFDVHFSSIFRCFREGFGVQVGFKIHPKPLQEPLKIHSKSHLVFACFFTSIFGRFFIDFSSIFDLPDLFRLTPLWYETQIRAIQQFCSCCALGCPLGPMLGPKNLDFGSQNPFKIAPKSIKDMSNCKYFLNMFGTIWGAF